MSRNSAIGRVAVLSGHLGAMQQDQNLNNSDTNINQTVCTNITTISTTESQKQQQQQQQHH
jgi:hypothetical protein